MKSESFSFIIPSSSAISAIVEISSLLKMEALFSLKPSLVNNCKIQRRPEYLNIGKIDDSVIVVNGASLFQ